MSKKQINGDCTGCESIYAVEYNDEKVSEELPEHCPFCGEVIESLSEYIEDDSIQEDDLKWEQ